MNIFMPGDILLPQEHLLDRWPVIACDQFTSDPDYWKRVRAFTDVLPGTVRSWC